ncbi:MAG: NAD-dependent succinate-semialdehyde dehydrogenase [Spirochaetia bacterium]
MSLVSINPATGRKIASYEQASAAEITRVLDAASRAYVDWSRRGITERASFFVRLAEGLRRTSEEAALLMADEMGKPVVQGRAEVEKCAGACEYFAENAERFLSPIDVPTDARKSYVTFRPLGVILAVMPWNFPWWQVFRAAIPAVLAGNAMVLKHSSNICGCALAVHRIFETAGFPPGVFTTVLMDSARIESLIADPRIQAVTLTGSTAAGTAVARAAGGALKKCVLELGGSDPCVILEDADLELAARTCAASRVINSGQSCIAAKRFVVVEKVRTKFEDLFVHAMSSQHVGQPREDSTNVGPLARADLRELVDRQVKGSIAGGARCLLGGSLPETDGFFYPPTVLTDVKKGIPAFDEEVFGPVAAVVPVRDEIQALAAANDTPFGLGATVFTRDLAKGEHIAAEELEAGSCFVNALVRSDQRLPFGGIKGSGYGRELSIFGMREFVNVRTVYIG